MAEKNRDSATRVPEVPKFAGPYMVANPRNIPTGTRILHNGEKDWYEGDDIKAGDIEDDAFFSLVERGFIVKASD